MINEKNKFLTVSWLSGLLSAEIFISTGEWGVQMPPLTSENSHFLRSGPQETTLVMSQPSRYEGLISCSVRMCQVNMYFYIFECVYSNMFLVCCRLIRYSARWVDWLARILAPPKQVLSPGPAGTPSPSAPPGLGQTPSPAEEYCLYILPVVGTRISPPQ